tara:strand:+ start:748 stop:1569 length:822 start_codon:yes stop_codon:yes gene_type:complete
MSRKESRNESGKDIKEAEFEDFTKLQRQLSLYEQGELEALETILTPTQSIASQSIASVGTNNKSIADRSEEMVDDLLTVLGGKDEAMIRDRVASHYSKESEADKPISIVQGDENAKKSTVNDLSVIDDLSVTSDGVDTKSYPQITQPIKEEINRIATEWIKLDESKDKIKQTMNELNRQQKMKEMTILNYIETYGLKDITKGRHQLVPKVVKGKKKKPTQKLIKQTMKDSLLEIMGELGVEIDADDVTQQMFEQMDENVGTAEDRVKLLHNRL